MSQASAVEKLVRVLGAARAGALVAEGMKAAGVSSLDDPLSRLRFGRVLARKQGVIEAIGHSIIVQALLEGAEDEAAP